MQHFHAITPVIWLFYESRPEKMGNHAITPTAGGASSFECFQYLTLKQIIWKTKTSFKKLRLKKVLSTINLNASLPCQKPMLMTVKGTNHKNDQAL